MTPQNFDTEKKTKQKEKKKEKNRGTNLNKQFPISNCYYLMQRFSTINRYKRQNKEKKMKILIQLHVKTKKRQTKTKETGKMLIERESSKNVHLTQHVSWSLKTK